MPRRRRIAPGRAVDPSAPSTVCAGTYGPGVLKSADGGSRTGSRATQDCRRPTSPRWPSHRGVLDALRRNGCRNAREQRRRQHLECGQRGSAHRDSRVNQEPRNRYVGGDTGISCSVDLGSTWAPLNLSVKRVPSRATAADSAAPSVLYSAGPLGISTSVDGGATWTLFNSGLGTTSVFDLWIDPSGSLLRASTAFGLFECRDPARR